MLRVAINIYPLKSAHKNRGIGYYTSNLLAHLEKENNLEVVRFEHPSEIKDVDVVHYPWFDFYFHTLPIRKKFKTVVTIHDTIPIIFPSHYPVGIKGKINFILQKLSLNWVDAIISDSESSKKDIIKYLGIKSSKIFSIPLAAEEDFKKSLNDTKLIQVRRKYKLPDRFLLYVGDANWVKNLPFLIKGFSEIIKKKELVDLRLVLIGGVFLKNVDNIDHPELESLKKVSKLINELDLSNKIIKPGNLEKEDLIAFYNLATVYVQPSIYEGFGLPILEALSCGTPVISSNGGSLPEVGGDAAVYFAPNNLPQFIKVLVEILLNQSLQKKLSNLALERATNFSWERVIIETREVYLRVLENA